MEKTEFAQLLKTEVESKIGKEVRLTKVLKNNDVTLTGISIIYPDSNVTATTYVEYYFNSYQQGACCVIKECRYWKLPVALHTLRAPVLSLPMRNDGSLPLRDVRQESSIIRDWKKRWSGLCRVKALCPAVYHLQDEKFIEKAKQNNLAVHVWTVNEEAQIRKFADQGVDAVITSYPDVARRVLRG